MPAREPQQLGDFEILELIGKGAMGTVYKARQSSLGRIVALKVLPAHYAADQEFLIRFRNEAAAAAGLNYPNIVHVYAAGEDSGTHFFAMEYVEGESLGARMERKGRIDAAEAIAIMCHLVQALDYAWKKAQVIHRDIKPDNIFLSNEGMVKLGDLGLAKLLGDQEVGLTQTGVAMGTPNYVSPEQAMGTKSVDFRSDIYSLGCTLYHAITGQPPYRGDSAIAVMLQHVSEAPPRIQTVWPECPPAIIGLLDRMLRKKPDERFESYAALLEQLFWVAERLDEPAPQDASLIVPMPAPRNASTPRGTRDFEPVANCPREKGPAPAHGRTKMLVIIAAAVAAAIAALAWQPWKSSGPRRSTSGTKSESAATLPDSVTPARGTGATPATATKDAPFVNSLGMKFVPVPITGGPSNGHRVLFSVWETRVQDYEAFVNATKRSWKKPNFEQGPTHPAVMMNWENAGAFCEWLTERERKAGVLGANERYRLPSDHEWSCAVGLGDREDAAKLPKDKKSGFPGEYPWGKGWPPPNGAANLAGEEVQLIVGKYDDLKGSIPGYRDAFVETAPVGSFAANQLGLFDLAGNAAELCEDAFAGANDLSMQKVVRGAAWTWTSAVSAYRHSSSVRGVHWSLGFRCVLDLAGQDKATASPSLAATPAPAPAELSSKSKAVPIPSTALP